MFPGRHRLDTRWSRCLPGIHLYHRRPGTDPGHRRRIRRCRYIRHHRYMFRYHNHRKPRIARIPERHRQEERRLLQALRSTEKTN